MSNPIQVPGRIGVEVQVIDGPNAQQHVIQAASGGAVKLLFVGGLSKREEIAARIAGQLASQFRTVAVGARSFTEPMPQDSQAIAAQAVAIADAVLAKCATEPQDEVSAQPGGEAS